MSWTLQPLVDDGRPAVKLQSMGATRDLGRSRLIPESAGHGSVHRLHVTLDVTDGGCLKATQRGKTSIAYKRGGEVRETAFKEDFFFLRDGDFFHLLNPVTANKECGYRVEGPPVRHGLGCGRLQSVHLFAPHPPVLAFLSPRLHPAWAHPPILRRL